MLIKGGRIITMNHKIYEKGDILLREGKIFKVGDNLNTYLKSNEEVINVEGAWIIPGMIDAHCHIGLREENMGGEGNDINEISSPITPHMRAIDGINPFDTAFEKARKAGITTVVTGPGSANVMGGQFAAIKTVGVCIDDMIVKAPLAIKIAFGENPKRVYKEKSQCPYTRMATVALLREVLMEGLKYYKKKNEAEKTNKSFEVNLKYEALIPLFEGRIHLKAHAHRADDILTAIRIAKEFNVNLTLDHCTEGHLIKDHIVNSGFGVIIGPTLSFNSKIELSNKTFKTPSIMVKNGAKVAIMTDHPVTPIEYLPLCAALAMKEGLEFEEALESITINAAEITGIDQKVGSIEEGKDGDIVILTGSPFEITTKTLYTIINGEIVYKSC